MQTIAQFREEELKRHTKVLGDLEIKSRIIEHLVLPDWVNIEYVHAVALYGRFGLLTFQMSLADTIRLTHVLKPVDAVMWTGNSVRFTPATWQAKDGVGKLIAPIRVGVELWESTPHENHVRWYTMVGDDLCEVKVMLPYAQLWDEVEVRRNNIEKRGSLIFPLFSTGGKIQAYQGGTRIIYWNEGVDVVSVLAGL